MMKIILGCGVAPLPLVVCPRGVLEHWHTLLARFAPELAVHLFHGPSRTLKDLRGAPVVLYFYPKADTPGCTTQACSIRDASDLLQTHKVEALGISPDPPEKLDKFDQKHSLRFPLLSDPESTVAKAYGAWGEKSMYGKKYEGIIRSSFLLDEKGKILQAWYKVSPKETVPFARQALGLAQPRVVAFVDRDRAQPLHQHPADHLEALVDPERVGLDNVLVAVLVDHQPGQPVRLAERQPEVVLARQRVAPPVPGREQPLADQLLVELILDVGVQPNRDQRVRVVQPGADEVAVVEHQHRVARPGLALRTSDLVGEHPGMPAKQGGRDAWLVLCAIYPSANTPSAS